MKSDIKHPKVEDIGIAVVRDTTELDTYEWNVYIVNFKDEPIDNVIIASKGYGQKKGESLKTSTLRHFYETIPGKKAERVEMILEEMIGLSNEYWVSFYIGMTIYDKKYVFLAETLQEKNFRHIPVLGKSGVLIR